MRCEIMLICSCLMLLFYAQVVNLLNPDKNKSNLYLTVFVVLMLQFKNKSRHHSLVQSLRCWGRWHITPNFLLGKKIGTIS